MDSEKDDVIEKSNVYDIYEHDENFVDDNGDDKPLVQLEVVYLQAKGGNCLFVKEFCFFKAMSVCF